MHQIHDKLPDGLTLISAEGFKEWFIDLRVLDPNPLYINKIFRLKFTFSDKYPMGTYSSPPSIHHLETLNLLKYRERKKVYSLTHPQNHPKSSSFSPPIGQSLYTPTYTPTASYVSIC